MIGGICIKKFFNKKTAPIVIGIFGACLILISSIFSSNDKEISTDPEYYSRILEDKVKDLLLQMEDIEAVSVLITLENSGSTIYAQNVSANSAEYVIYTSDNKQKGLVLAEIAPQVRGIAVICTNGNDIKVQTKIISVLSSALGVSTNRITVCG